MYSILILDKNDKVASMYKDWLVEIKRDAHILHFTDGADAYEYAINNKVNLFIVSDDGAMDMSGYNFADQIRASNVHEMTSIVFISPSADKKHLVYEELKCYHYFTEPVNKSDFRGVFSKLFKHQAKIDKKDYIKLYNNNTTTKIALDKVVCVEIDNKDIILYSKEAILMKVSAYHYPLEELEALLGTGFVRIHQSVIVNKEYIHCVDYTNRLVHVIRSKRSAAGQVSFKLGITYVRKVKEQWG